MPKNAENADFLVCQNAEKCRRQVVAAHCIVQIQSRTVLVGKSNRKIQGMLKSCQNAAFRGNHARMPIGSASIISTRWSAHAAVRTYHGTVLFE